MRLDVTLARIRSIVGEGCAGQVVSKTRIARKPFASNLLLCPLRLRQTQTGNAARRHAAIRPAETVTVTVRNQQPDSFIFREKRYTVERAYGPWSSGGDWWRPTLWSLEQWDLVARAHDAANQATWLCCCLTRDLTQDHWQVEALYD